MKSRGRSLHSLKPALVMVWRSGPRLAIAQTALTITQALLPLVTLVALKRTVDAAGEAIGGGAFSGPFLQAFGQPAAGKLVFWLIVGAAAIGAQACIRAMGTWMSEQLAMAVSDNVHARLHSKMEEVDLAFFEEQSKQNRLHLVQNQAMAEPIRILDGLFMALHGAVALAGVLILLATLHPVIPLTVALSGLPVLLLRIQRSRRMYAWRAEMAPLEREANYFHGLMVSGSVAQEIRLFGHGPFLRGRFETVRGTLRAKRLLWRRYILSRELLMQAIMLAVLTLLMAWLTWRVLAGLLTLGSLVMAIQALQRGQAQTASLASTMAEVYQSLLFLQSYEELIGEPATITSPKPPAAVPTPVRRGLVFENVSFTYPGTSKAVLRNIDLAIRPGEHIALAGANGAGKTTMAKLIARLYDPTAGRILIDGVDLRELDPAEWRRRIGMAFQDFGRYQLTAAENIWIGDPRGESTDGRIAESARLMGLSEALDAWPEGLLTPLGRTLRDGVEPSVGQWQRIALARTFLRDASLLILDEPNSSLDAKAGRELVESLRKLAEGRMALIASHRPEIIEWADRVIMLQDGRISESGTIEKLLADGGAFARLFMNENRADHENRA